MSDEKMTVREKIIFAVIECIEREGIQGVTTRSIVKEADVNIAADLPRPSSECVRKIWRNRYKA